MAAHYTWTSIYTAEDSSRGPDARDTVMEEEVVRSAVSGITVLPGPFSHNHFPNINLPPDRYLCRRQAYNRS
jgi:hypothetical protein